MIMKAKPDNKKKRYIIYTRCSTDDQAQGDYTTLDAQAHHCKNMIDAFGYEMAAFGKSGVVYDDGYSGKDLNRPGIQSVLNDIHSGKKSFDGLIFLRLDRLTRNTRDLYWLIDLFNSKEIAFVSVRENLDSSTAIGRVVIGILGILSAFERELTGERVKASCIARARQGKWTGGALPLGYKLINDGPMLPNGRQPHKVVINEEIGPKLRAIWQMAAENKSLTEIGNTLVKLEVPTYKGKSWRKQSIAAILKSPFYKGMIRYAGELHKGNHPPLIDDGLWEKANKILTGNTPKHYFTKKPKEYVYLLNGILRCGKCGSHYISYFANGRSRKFFYYACSRSLQRLGCDVPNLPATQLDQAVIDFFRVASQNQDIIVKAVGDAAIDAKDKLGKVQKEIKQAEEKLKIAREKADKLLSLAIEGAISKGATYKTKMDALDNEIFALQEKLSKLEAQRKVAQMTANSSEFLYSNFKFAIQYLDKATPENQKALLQLLIKSITVLDDRVEFRMYVGSPYEEIACHLPENTHNNPGNAPKNSNAPQDHCRALVPTAGGSNIRPEWLPNVVFRRTAEPQVVQLVVKMDIRRSKRILLSLVDPLPPVPVRKPRIYPNTIVEALKIKAFINSGQTKITWAKTCRELNISESKLAHLLKIVNKLPPEFVENMKQCGNQETLRIFTGRRLLNISRLKTIQERRDMINQLLLPR
ncbi:MAG: hypothetical protein C4533_07935 [Candidatus Omnitrophota bacterium]|jgi:site-specific DNA recombinase|nr:MAG: hypothetical protein C4533_07935 [Candidatus Omnitrophota bacterium]